MATFLSDNYFLGSKRDGMKEVNNLGCLLFKQYLCTKLEFYLHCYNMKILFRVQRLGRSSEEPGRLILWTTGLIKHTSKYITFPLLPMESAWVSISIFAFPSVFVVCTWNRCTYYLLVYITANSLDECSIRVEWIDNIHPYLYHLTHLKYGSCAGTYYITPPGRFSESLGWR